MKISPHFSLEEFERCGPMPLECRHAYVELANEILEPVRRQFSPIVITSGYRSPESNDAAHGIPNSEHIASENWCAADFVVCFPAALSSIGSASPQVMRATFDWMRNNPFLPFHQLILEHGQTGTVIHVSWNRLKPCVRSVLEGATHNAEPYVAIDHVPFIPKSDDPTALGVDESTQV